MKELENQFQQVLEENKYTRNENNLLKNKVLTLSQKIVTTEMIVSDSTSENKQLKMVVENFSGKNSEIQTEREKIKEELKLSKLDSEKR